MRGTLGMRETRHQLITTPDSLLTSTTLYAYDTVVYLYYACTCVHACMHACTCMHECMHACMHTDIQTYVRAQHTLRCLQKSLKLDLFEIERFNDDYRMKTQHKEIHNNT